MIKTATASVLRKLRATWLQCGLFLLALSVSYILLINGIFYSDWALIIFSIIVMGALHLGEQPLISKKEIRIHKVFGASQTNIWPLIFGQSLIKAIITSFLALALSGATHIDKILPISSLFTSENFWIIPIVTLMLFLFIVVFHFALFHKTKAYLSHG